MPRTKLGRDAYRLDDLRKLIRRYQGRDIHDEACAKMAKTSAVTFRKRMAEPQKGRCYGVGNLSVNELLGLQRGLGIPGAEISKVLFE